MHIDKGVPIKSSKVYYKHGQFSEWDSSAVSGACHCYDGLPGFPA